MTSPHKSRREFLKNTGRVAAASALVTGVVPQVHAAADDTIQVALIGCGGRGTGAVANALAVPNGRTKLVAMADVFDSRLKSSYENLNRQFAKQVDVPAERKFVSFDGYKMAMDCLNPGDVVIMTTPCAFRGLHFAYAIEKGLHVFMEKPLTADGPSSRLMFELGEKSVKKNKKT